MITNQLNFCFFGGPKETLIHAPTGFIQHPHVISASADEGPSQTLPYPSTPEHTTKNQQEHNHQHQLLMDFMPITSSVDISDSNSFSDGSGDYSSYGYSDDSNHTLTGLVYHPQSAIYYDNNSNITRHVHLQNPLIILPQQEQQGTLESSNHKIISSSKPSSAPVWSSWTPVLDEPRLLTVAEHHFTTTTKEESEQATFPKTEVAVRAPQNAYAFQLFDSSASLQKTTSSRSSNSGTAVYDTRHRTNSLVETSIGYSAQNASLPPLFNNTKDGLVKYWMPSKQLTVASWLRPHLQSYLLATDPLAMGERVIVVLTGKVAQKSYGTEKRFLCPPPTIILDGAAWWTRPTIASKCQQHLTETDEDTPPKLSVAMSGESEMQEGQVDWFSQSGAMVGQTGFTALPQTNNVGGTGDPTSKLAKNIMFDNAINTADRDWVRFPAHDPLEGGKCLLRQLYINDTDEKRKWVECLVNISMSNGVNLGTVTSRPIKVISKPSKKRLSMKNTDSCIHHGTMVSLFNRIRSQTVSTKYLAVATASPSTGLQKFTYPGQIKAFKPTSHNKQEGDPCFTARTGSWDPFVIWVVDTNWVPPTNPRTGLSRTDADEYIGSCAATIRNDMVYPPPPTIATKNKTGQPLAIHYNQHVVLQCVTTGLVSPVMIIRKVDRASTVVGGANSKHYAHLEGIYGGEYGDEILGDPVSQLHRVALQMVKCPEINGTTMDTKSHTEVDMMPRSNRPASYLACLNDVVAIHRSTHDRKPIQTADDANAWRAATRRRLVSAGNDVPQSDFYIGVMNGSLTHHYSTMSIHDDRPLLSKRRRSAEVSGEEGSLEMSPQGPICWPELGAYWSEDVADSAVWTIAGIDCVKYTLWEPPGVPVSASNDSIMPASMLPVVFSYSRHNQIDQKDREEKGAYIKIHGKSLSHDLEVWFGDVRSPQTKYHSDEQIVCEVPSQSEMAQAVGSSWNNERVGSIPLLLVKRDGKAVYKTSKDYVFY